MTRACATAILFLFFTSTALADTTGVLTGTVVDEKQAAVPGVTVTIVSPSYECRTTTDDRGNFSFLNVPPDRYTLQAEREKYEPVAYSGIVVSTVEPFHIGVRLEHAMTHIIRDFVRPPGIFAAYKPDGMYLVNPYTFPMFNSAIRIGDMLRFVPGIIVGP